MVTTRKTRTKRSRSRSLTFKKAVPGKPSGVIQARVQKVGPEKFGIVAVDCAKARFKWMLAFGGDHWMAPFGVLKTDPATLRRRLPESPQGRPAVPTQRSRSIPSV